MYIIYSKKNCTYCDQAKTLLNMKGFEFTERKIDEDPKLLEELKGLVPNVKTVPQIFKVELVREGGLSRFEHIGGFTELDASFRT